jgi:hypothetical protein
MHAHLVTFRQCFFWQFCFIAKVTNDPQEDLAKFWLQAKYESKNQKKPPSMFVGCLLEPCIKIWRFFLNFDPILTIENLKKHMILALSIFLI